MQISWIYKIQIEQSWKQMPCLHSPPHTTFAFYSFFSINEDNSPHKRKKKTGQKPEVMTTPSAQLLSLAAELHTRTPVLSGSERDGMPPEGPTVMATIMRCWHHCQSPWGRPGLHASGTVLDEVGGLFKELRFTGDASSFCKWKDSISFPTPRGGFL